MHEAVAGDDARACGATRSATSRRTGRAIPASGGTATSRRSRPTASGSCTVVPTTRSSSRASGSARPRSRRSSSAIRRWSRPRPSGFPTTLKGEALWVFVVPAAGRRCRRRAPRRAHGAGHRASRIVLPAFGGALHDRAAEDPQRQGSAPGHPCRRHRRRRPVTCRVSKIREHSMRSRTPPDLELVGARVLLRPLRPDDWESWRDVRRAQPRVARSVGAATGARRDAIPCRSAKRSARGAARGTGSGTSTPRTASGCSCSTAASRAR